MRWVFCALCVLLSSGLRAAETPPPWAYVVNPPNFRPIPDTGAPRQVPGSVKTFTLTQVRDLFFAPDWHPGDHPAMPDVVAAGRRPEIRACGVCHRVNGTGGPENASLAGLPAAYILRQMDDYRSGARTTSVQRIPISLMIATAKSASEAEMKEAADYFASLKPLANVKVVESADVPKTQIYAWHLTIVPGGGTEPLGRRIIEIPDDLAQFESRDGRATFTAFVPPGSIEQGRILATAGERAMACSGCHGPDLRGLDAGPPIAGRSPTYLFRQMNDFRTGARAGAESAPMRALAESLTVDDMIALSAYAASLSP